MIFNTNIIFVAKLIAEEQSNYTDLTLYAKQVVTIYTQTIFASHIVRNSQTQRFLPTISTLTSFLSLNWLRMNRLIIY